MKGVKKLLSVLMVSMMVLAIVFPVFTPVGAQGLTFNPGTYVGVSDEGFAGSVEATVTVSENAIESIVVASDGETPDIGGNAMTMIAEEIVANQSLAVDTVSGATLSSNAILAAITDALTQAEGDIDYLTDEANRAEVAVVEQEDIYTDVVVVGGGGAGLTAALEAVNNGANVVLLEKMSMLGGNTLRATGGMNAAETDVQEALGIEDSVEVFYQDTLEGGHGINDPDLLRVMVENSAEALSWVNDLGAGLTDVSFSGGATNPRIHKPEDGSAVGPLIVRVLEVALSQQGVEPMLEVEATALIQDETGRVIGVTAVNKDGVEFNVYADAVILATGGFGANQEMVEEYNPELVGFGTTNAPGALGQGIEMALAVGADTVDMEQIQIHPTTQPGTGKLYTEGLRGDGAILVNKEGQRFIDELKTRDVVSQAILAETDGEAYLIVNQELVDQNASMASYIEQGDAIAGATVEELAANLSMDAATLQATLDAYNEAQASGVDEAFGRENMTMSLAEGPYYALLVTPSIHHTMGGLHIDTNTHVLNTEGEIIPGLYAAGEVTGGIHGGNRIGGNAVLDIVVFGRIAGQTAVAEINGAVETEASDEEEVAEETEEVTEEETTEEDVEEEDVSEGEEDISEETESEAESEEELDDAA
ncbi:flavocytochrome c [Fundicoccus culcitae]|uniref:Urocanate reductase n=1 Tax=Fundicoccus culcitae TaxID=2969821 RepID=A0ABY5P8F5_9LACT|nr:flavocytochrome c [Fundicoccus culcitae]UUX34799.1 flavocytochrome c [Fundicoccus culcitae]